MMRSGEQAAANLDLPPTFVRRHVDGPRVVAIGGGTGLPNVLRGMRPLLYAVDRPAARDRLIAIVATTDDGGSSGRLRSAFGIIPPGDIRNCLAALSDNHALIADIFQYRFDSGDGLSGHAIGNLVLTALADVTQDFARAVEIAARVVGARGTVLPATAEVVTLVADFEDGRVLSGETAIAGAQGRIRRVSLLPERPRHVPEVTHARRAADLGGDPRVARHPHFRGQPHDRARGSRRLLGSRPRARDRAASGRATLRPRDLQHDRHS
jgi:2-phospho-L-lactate transferase/gluconeogenesis factor (CofD/UPF0052 family)